MIILGQHTLISILAIKKFKNRYICTNRICQGGTIVQNLKNQEKNPLNLAVLFCATGSYDKFLQVNKSCQSQMPIIS